MCLRHWATVSPGTQREVYRTVKLREEDVGASWAPWWRAQAKAIYEAALADGLDKDACDRYLAAELRIAAQLDEHGTY